MRGDGTQYRKTDKQIEKGMDPTDCAFAMVKAMFDREYEVWICPVYYKVFIPIMQMFPSVQAWYLLRRLREQLSTIGS